MKAAAIYARVSTADQVKGTSLDGQVALCQDYAKEHGYTVVKVMQEDASGARLDRPKLSELRNMAEKREIEALIVFDPDRLSRSMAHMMLLMEDFERNKSEVIFVNAPREDTPEGEMLFGMRALFAQYERTKIMERSRRGKERRAKEGKVITSWAAPYGYRFVTGEGRFEIVDAEALLVVRMFDWYINEGASLRGIAARLNDLGVPTKRGVKCWSPSTIRAILTNATYGGTWYYNKSESAVALHRRFVNGPKPKHEKSGQRARPKEEWIGVEVPAIISNDLYAGVKVQMERNARLQKRNCKREYLLRGLLTCKQCGRRLTGRSTTPAYNQYYCTGKYDNSLRATCKCPWPNAAKLDRRVWEKIVTLMSDEKLIAETLQSHEHNREAERTREDEDIQALYRNEQSLKTEEERLIDAYAKGVIEVDQLRERTSVIRKQKDALRQVRAEIQERIQQREAIKVQQATIARHVALAKKGLPALDFEDRRAFLEAISFKGVVDGATGTLLITGFIRDILMSISGKVEEDGEGGEGGEGGEDKPMNLSTQRGCPL